jgi:hypothetical protein
LFIFKSDPENCDVLNHGLVVLAWLGYYLLKEVWRWISSILCKICPGEYPGHWWLRCSGLFPINSNLYRSYSRVLKRLVIGRESQGTWVRFAQCLAPDSSLKYDLQCLILQVVLSLFLWKMGKMNNCVYWLVGETLANFAIFEWMFVLCMSLLLTYGCMWNCIIVCCGIQGECHVA